MICAAIALVASGCESGRRTHQLFYGTTPPPVVSVTVGDVEAIKSIGRGVLTSPSIISPNQLAVIKMVEILKGEGVGERIGIAYEEGISNEFVVKQRYVFLWDQTETCIQYFTVKGKFYVKDGREIPLDELKK
jgi:hypothetical protein